MGMGGAFVALADDASAIMFNPAGLGQIEKAQVAAAYDKLYAGLGDGDLGRGFISYVQPAQYYGAFALNLALLNTPLYKETTVTFGYGRPFGRAYLGVNAKGLFATFEENEYTRFDPLFKNNGTRTAKPAFDLGMLYKLTDNLSFGLAGLNINEPNMALDEDVDAAVPFTLQTGIALRLGNTVPTIDVTYRNKDLGDDKDINFHVGMESWLAGRSVALRAGANRYDMAVGASYVFSRGNSVEAQLDYAFRYPLAFKDDAISDTYGSHQFSLDVRFEGITAARSEAVVEKVEREDAQPEAAELLEEVKDYREKGKHEEAIELCSGILELDSDGAQESQLEAHIQMAGALSQLGRHDEAFEHLQAAVKIAPEDPRTHYAMGMFYRESGDRSGNSSLYNKAIIEFEKTRVIDPEFENVSAELAALKKRR